MGDVEGIGKGSKFGAIKHVKAGKGGLQVKAEEEEQKDKIEKISFIAGIRR